MKIVTIDEKKIKQQKKKLSLLRTFPVFLKSEASHLFFKKD